MIYEFPESKQPIRQGDIFKSIPHVYYDPQKLIAISGDKIKGPVSWADNSDAQDLRIIVRAKSCYGIVVTQDCDTQRDDNIAFFEIDEFFTVTGFTRPPDPKKLAKWWAEQLPQKARAAQKWFYLPAHPQIGFSEKMAADFQSLITVPSQFVVENLGNLRVGRLNYEADEHFREQVAQYFRRYPYDEWYALTKEEFEIYKKQPYRDNCTPRSYQE